MEVVQVIGVVLMFAILLYAIIKKIQPTVLLLILGVVGLAVAHLAKGTMPMGSQTTGIFPIDLFEVVRERFATLLGSNVLVISSAMAFVAYVDHIKATKMFAAIASRSIRKVKAKYLLVALAIVLMSFLNMFVTSAAGRASLYLTTIYPLLIAANVSVATAASALWLAANYWNVGPASGIVLTALTTGGSEIGSVEQFMTNDIKVMAVVMLVTIPVFCVVNWVLDKKDRVKNVEEVVKEQEELDISSLGIPKWFGILPMIPLVLCMVMNSLVLGDNIILRDISLPAAMIIGWVIALICNLFFGRKSKKELFNEGQEYFTGLGKGIGYVGCLIITAGVFSLAITEIGGLDVIIKAVTGGAGEGSAVLAVAAVVTVMYTVSVAVTGSPNANIAAFSTMMSGVASGTQYNKLISMLVPGGASGAALSPIAGVNILIAGHTGLSIPRLISRAIIPTIAAVLTSIVAAAIFF